MRLLAVAALIVLAFFVGRSFYWRELPDVPVSSVQVPSRMLAAGSGGFSVSEFDAGTAHIVVIEIGSHSLAVEYASNAQ